jgi:hypothetical protein
MYLLLWTFPLSQIHPFYLYSVVQNLVIALVVNNKARKHKLYSIRPNDQLNTGVLLQEMRRKRDNK